MGWDDLSPNKKKKKKTLIFPTVYFVKKMFNFSGLCQLKNHAT